MGQLLSWLSLEHINIEIMVRRDQISLFISDINALGLRFPVATIARRMQANKANVSAYVRGVKSASVKFILRFYAEFERDLAAVGIKRDSSLFLAQGSGSVAAAEPDRRPRNTIGNSYGRPIEYGELNEKLMNLMMKLDHLVSYLEGIGSKCRDMGASGKL